MCLSISRASADPARFLFTYRSRETLKPQSLHRLLNILTNDPEKEMLQFRGLYLYSCLPNIDLFLSGSKRKRLACPCREGRNLWGAVGRALGGLGAVMASGQGGRDLLGAACTSALGKNFACKLAMSPLKSSLGNSSHPHFLGTGRFIQRGVS